MAQKANLTPVDKYESDRREAERLDLEKHARLEAGLIDPVSAIQPAPTCACRKLNPAILVMQSIQDWATKNVPDAIDSARDRRIFLQG